MPVPQSPHTTHSCLSARPQSSMAAHPSVPFSSTHSSGCCAASFPLRRPQRTPLLTCVARSLAVRPSPIVVGRAADPTIAAGAHVPWRLGLPQPSKGTHEHGQCWWCSRAATHRRLSPRQLKSTGRPCIPYVAYICFKCFKWFRCMLQLFHLHVCKVQMAIGG
jgi:hypothetical protein